MNKEMISKNSGIIISVTKRYNWCIDNDTNELYTLIDGKEAEGSRSADNITAWVFFWERVDMFMRRRIKAAELKKGREKH